jgi:hypothetical protein
VEGLVNEVMKLRVPLNFGKFLSSCTTGGLSTRAQLHEVINDNDIYRYLLPAEVDIIILTGILPLFFWSCGNHVKLLYMGTT